MIFRRSNHVAWPRDHIITACIKSLITGRFPYFYDFSNSLYLAMEAVGIPGGENPREWKVHPVLPCRCRRERGPSGTRSLGAQSFWGRPRPRTEVINLTHASKVTEPDGALDFLVEVSKLCTLFYTKYETKNQTLQNVKELKRSLPKSTLPQYLALFCHRNCSTTIFLNKRSSTFQNSE